MPSFDPDQKIVLKQKVLRGVLARLDESTGSSVILSLEPKGSLVIEAPKKTVISLHATFPNIHFAWTKNSLEALAQKLEQKNINFEISEPDTSIAENLEPETTVDERFRLDFDMDDSFDVSTLNVTIATCKSREDLSFTLSLGVDHHFFGRSKYLLEYALEQLEELIYTLNGAGEQRILSGEFQAKLSDVTKKKPTTSPNVKQDHAYPLLTDVVGQDAAREKLEEIISTFQIVRLVEQGELARREDVADLLAQVAIPTGAFLVGPAGVGKTMCAEAFVNELVNPLGGGALNPYHETIRYSTTDSKWVSQGSQNVRDLFNRLRNGVETHGFSVLYIKEADSLLTAKEFSGTYKPDLVSAFKSELDNAERILIIADTNHRNRIDSACASKIGPDIEFKFLTGPNAVDIVEGLMVQRRVGGLAGIDFAALRRDTQIQKKKNISGRDLKNASRQLTGGTAVEKLWSIYRDPSTSVSSTDEKAPFSTHDVKVLIMELFEHDYDWES